MNEKGMIYFKIHLQAVTAADFQVCLEEIKIKCSSKGIDTVILSWFLIMPESITHEI